MAQLHGWAMEVSMLFTHWRQILNEVHGCQHASLDCLCCLIDNPAVYHRRVCRCRHDCFT